jgi:hypothetical protein
MPAARGGKSGGRQAWGAGSKKSPRHISGEAGTVPAADFFIWDRGQRHEATEQQTAAQENQQPSQRWRSSPRRNGDPNRSVKTRLADPLGRFVGFPLRFTELGRRSPAVCISNPGTDRTHLKTWCMADTRGRIGMVASSRVLGRVARPPGKQNAGDWYRDRPGRRD